MPLAEISGGLCSRRGPLLAGVAGLLAFAAPAAAQQDRISQEVVQQLPARDSLDLNAALARLGRNPRDVEALIDAGKAALAMGDADAAVGFFGRADQISPGNPRVKAGLAGAMVRNESPFEAISLFDEAERGGVLDGTFAADRGLAYDLVGDNATAQRHYREVLALGANDEATRRLALSLAMSGDKQGAERTLAPLLSRRDKAAFRTRAFALAIVGEVEGAVGIAYATLPQDIAASISPYLRYMPRLTRAQQAAAANFGHFPRASEIGRDDPRVARYAATAQRSAALAAASKGEQAGRDSRARGKRKGRTSRNAAVAAATPPVPARTAPPEPPQVSREISIPASGGKPARRVVVAAAQAVPTPPPAATPSAAPRPALTLPSGASPTPQIVLPTRPPSAPPPSSAQKTMGPILTGADPSAQARRPAAVTPAPPRSVADVFDDFASPVPNAAPTAGAVDIRTIKPARAKPREAATNAAPPPAPTHPSRIWVQVATGRNKDALGFDWRRMSRDAPELFRDKKANVSAWGQTNRLLAGPFPTEAAATAFIGQLRRAGNDGPFIWTSPAGQVVDTIAVP